MHQRLGELGFAIIIFILTVSGLCAQPIVSLDPAIDLNGPAQARQSNVLIDDNWQVLLADPDVPFEKVREAFYSEWKDKEYQKHQGYKQFKRLEYDLQGFYHLPYLRALQEMQERNTPHTGYQRNAANANWSLVGLQNSALPATWNNEGIGRINVLAFDPTNVNIYYAGGHHSGLWKSSNAGTSWVALGDDFSTYYVTDIAVYQSNPNHIYALTGTQGIRKSTNGGSSWSSISISSVYSNFRLLVHPTNSQIMMVANAVDGVLRTTNGGTSWSTATGTSGWVTDLEFKPNDPNTVYASSRDGKVWRSTNGGSSFTQMSTPFSSSTVSRTALAVTPDNSAAVFVMCGNPSFSSLTGLYKSTNSGTSWSLITDLSANLTYMDGSALGTMGSISWGQISHNWSLAVHPDDESEIYMGAISLARTSDGGSNWKYVSGSGSGGGSIHVDMMTVDYHPTTYVPMVGCDGGISRYVDETSEWTRLHNGLAVSTMYEISVCQLDPEHAATGHQDNGLIVHDDGTWYYRQIGDVFKCMMDPVNPNTMYTSTTTSVPTVFRSTDNGQSLLPIIDAVSVGESVTGAFNQPTTRIHPIVRHTLFTAFENVFKSIDGGSTWQNLSNGAIDNSMKTILEIAPSNPKIIYVGSGVYNQTLYRTSNGGTTWAAIGRPDVGGTIYDDHIYRLVVDDDNANHIFAATQRGVWQSTNGGSSWSQVGTLTEAVRALDHQRGSTNELYAGTLTGLYYKDGAQPWEAYDDNLPTVKIYDLEISTQDNKVRCATYGRGMWESPLETSNTFCFQTTIPTISPNSKQVLCTTPSVTLTSAAAPASYGYQWYLGDEPISGATDQALSVTNTGIYSVVYTGSCHGYSSALVEVFIGCEYSACGAFNPSTPSGPGNTTIVNINGPFEPIDPSADEVKICAEVNALIYFSAQVFDIIGEDGLTYGRTIHKGDFSCGVTPSSCFTIPKSTYESWIADGTLSLTFDPISTYFYPSWCTTNEICATVGVPRAACQAYQLTGDVSGSYPNAQFIEINGGYVNPLNTVFFEAHDYILIDINSEFKLNSTVTIRNKPCN